MSEINLHPPEKEQPKEPSPTKEELAQAKALEKRKRRKRRLRAFRDLLLRTFLLALVVYVLLFHLVGVTMMPNGDMYPRLDHGDLVLFYRLEKSIHAQDIVVFQKPTAMLDESYADAELVVTAVPRAEKVWWRQALDFLGFVDPADPPMTQLICRVVAGPGDTVDISEGDRLLVNGNSMIETNIFYPTPVYGTFVEYPLTLGENEYFVLADFRDGGADSRFFGPVTRDEILGPVITIMRRNNL